MRYMTVNGVTTHYRDDGPRDGPALVFSNSLGTDLRIWDPLIPHLPPGLRLIRYDTRGHGLSDAPPHPWTIPDHADDLAALLDELGVARAVICGLSVGGLIAQQLAASRPDLVRALILSDTAAKIGTDEMWNGRIARVSEAGVGAIADGVLERWFTPAFRQDDPGFPIWRNMLVRTAREGYVGTSAAIREADLTEQTRQLDLPCLAIVGEADGATPPDLVRATAALLPNCRFEVIAGAGHIPNVEQPEATARLIAAFLSTLD